MKINQFNKSTNFEALRADINAALKAVGQKYDLHLHAGNGSYNTEVFTLKLNCTTLGKGGTIETPEAKAFKTNAEMYGLKATDLGKTVTIQGREFEITGLKPKSRNCVIGKDVRTGKGFKLPLAGVKRSLGYEVGRFDEQF
jgi:hypothetical protein